MNYKQNQERNWLSIYLFYDDLNNLLIEFINPFIHEAYVNQYITEFFFIRYWEKGKHIRLRLLPNKNIGKEKLTDIFMKRRTEFMNKEMIDIQSFRIDFVEYIEEAVRYGGESSITVAERNFELSSNTIIDILASNQEMWDYDLSISMAIQMHVLFIKAMKINREDVIFFLEYLLQSNLCLALKNKNPNNNENEKQSLLNYFKKSYQLQSNKIDRICHYSWDINHFSSEDWQFTWFNGLKSNICEFYKLQKLGKIEFSKWIKLTSNRKISKDKLSCWSIFNSCFHMTNNRLGIYLRDEPFIYFLLLNSINKVYHNK